MLRTSSKSIVAPGRLVRRPRSALGPSSYTSQQGNFLNDSVESSLDSLAEGESKKRSGSAENRRRGQQRGTTRSPCKNSDGSLFLRTNNQIDTHHTNLGHVLPNPDETEPNNTCFISSSLAFKLCKKIAHLTRVIAEVHQVNDQNHAYLCIVVQNYEQSMSSLETELKNQQNKALETIDATKDKYEQQLNNLNSDWEVKLAALQNEAQTEKLKLQDAWETERTRLIKDRMAESHAQEQRFLKVQTELNETKEALEAQKDYNRELSVRMEQILIAHQSTTEELQATKEQWDDNRTSWESELENHRSQWENERTDLMKLREIESNEQNRLLNATKIQIEELENELNSKSSITQNLETQLQEQKCLCDQNENLIKSLESKLTQQAAEHLAVLDSRATIESTLSQTIEQLKGELSTTQSELKQEKESKRIIMESQNAESVKLSTNLANVTHQLVLEQEHSKGAIKKVKELELSLEEAKRRSDGITSAFASERARLEIELHRKDAELRDLTANISLMEQTLQAQKADLVLNHERISQEAELLRKQLELTKESMTMSQVNATAEITDLRSKLLSTEKQVADISMERDIITVSKVEALKSLKDKYDTDQISWNKELENLRQQAKSDMAKCTHRYESIIADLRSLVEDSKLKADQERDRAATFQRECEQLKMQVELHEKLQQELKLAYERIQSFNVTVEDLSKSNGELSAKLEESRQILDEKDKSEVSFQNRLNDALTLINTHEGTIGKLLEKLSILQSMESQVEQEINRNSTLSEDIQCEQHRVELLSEEIKQVQLNLQSTIKQLNDTSAERDMMQKLFDQKSKEYEDEIMAVKTQLETSRIKLEEDYQAQRMEMISMHQSEMESLRQRQLISANESKEKLEALIEESAQNEMKWKNELDTTRLEYEKAKADFENSVNIRENLSRQFQEERFSLKAASEREMGIVQNQYREQAKQMLSEFESAQLYLKSEIERLTRALEASEVKYLHRESRPEDIERIQHYELEVERRNRALANMTDELSRYKLELQSREDSLHRLFGNRPLVGTLNPTAKPGLSSSSTSRVSSDSVFNKSTTLPPLGKVNSVDSLSIQKNSKFGLRRVASAIRAPTKPSSTTVPHK